MCIFGLTKECIYGRSFALLYVLWFNRILIFAGTSAVVSNIKIRLRHASLKAVTNLFFKLTFEAIGIGTQSFSFL